MGLSVITTRLVDGNESLGKGREENKMRHNVGWCKGPREQETIDPLKTVTFCNHLPTYEEEDRRDHHRHKGGTEVEGDPQ